MTRFSLLLALAAPLNAALLGQIAVTRGSRTSQISAVQRTQTEINVRSAASDLRKLLRGERSEQAETAAKTAPCFRKPACTRASGSTRPPCAWRTEPSTDCPKRSCTGCARPIPSSAPHLASVHRGLHACDHPSTTVRWVLAVCGTRTMRALLANGSRYEPRAWPRGWRWSKLLKREPRERRQLLQMQHGKAAMMVRCLILRVQCRDM